MKICGAVMGVGVELSRADPKRFGVVTAKSCEVVYGQSGDMISSRNVAIRLASR